MFSIFIFDCGFIVFIFHSGLVSAICLSVCLSVYLSIDLCLALSCLSLSFSLVSFVLCAFAGLVDFTVSRTLTHPNTTWQFPSCPDIQPSFIRSATFSGGTTDHAMLYFKSCQVMPAQMKLAFLSIIMVLKDVGAVPTGPCEAREATVEGCIGPLQQGIRIWDYEKAMDTAQSCECEVEFDHSGVFYGDADKATCNGTRNDVCVFVDDGVPRCVPVADKPADFWVFHCAQHGSFPDKCMRNGVVCPPQARIGSYTVACDAFCPEYDPPFMSGPLSEHEVSTKGDTLFCRCSFAKTLESSLSLLSILWLAVLCFDTRTAL